MSVCKDTEERVTKEAERQTARCDEVKARVEALRDNLHAQIKQHAEKMEARLAQLAELQRTDRENARQALEQRIIKTTEQLTHATDTKVQRCEAAISAAKESAARAVAGLESKLSRGIESVEKTCALTSERLSASTREQVERLSASTSEQVEGLGDAMTKQIATAAADRALLRSDFKSKLESVEAAMSEQGTATAESMSTLETKIQSMHDSGLPQPFQHRCTLNLTAAELNVRRFRRDGRRAKATCRLATVARATAYRDK
jgi:autotransporter adhesin